MIRSMFRYLFYPWQDRKVRRMERMSGMMGREKRASKGQCSSSHTLFMMPVHYKSLKPTELFNKHENHLNIVQNRLFSLCVCVFSYLLSEMITVLVVIVTVSVGLVGRETQHSFRQSQYKSLQGISEQNTFLSRNSSAQIDNCLRAACHLLLPLCFFGCLICLLLLLSLRAEAGGDKTKPQY